MIPVTLQMSMHDIGLYLEGRMARIAYRDEGSRDTQHVTARIMESTDDDVIFTPDDVEYYSLAVGDIYSITEVE